MLQQDAVTKEASASTAGSSRAGIVLHGCLELRQRLGPLYLLSTSHWMQTAPRKEKKLYTRQSSLAEDNSYEPVAIHTDQQLEE